MDYNATLIYIYIYIYIYMWGQRTWVPQPVLNNKLMGPTEEENVRG